MSHVKIKGEIQKCSYNIADILLLFLKIFYYSDKLMSCINLCWIM